jgi:hypothetical protein
MYLMHVTYRPAAEAARTAEQQPQHASVPSSGRATTNRPRTVQLVLSTNCHQTGPVDVMRSHDTCQQAEMT